MNNQLKSYAIIALMSSGVTLGAYSLFNLGNTSGFSDAPSAFTTSVSNPNVPGNPGEFTYAAEKTTPAVVHIKTKMEVRQRQQSSSPFDDFFGFGDPFGGGGGRGGPRRGADIGYVMELDLEDAVGGVEKRVELPTLAGCDDCDGSGSEDGKVETCKTCAGRGQVRMQRGIFAVQQACPACGGRGQTISKPCKSCHGNGRVQEDKVLQVKIPAGVDNGDRIRLAGEGEAGPGGAPAGDLLTTICEEVEEMSG